MAMKENQHVQPVIDLAAGTVTFNVKDHEALVLHADKLHADVMRRAALVGLAQVRVVDAAAVPAADKDGNIIPEARRLSMKHERMAALIEHLETGTSEWSRVGSGGGGLSITIEAIAAIQSKPYEQVESEIETFAAAKYAGDTKKALAYLRQGARVAAKIEELRKARLPAPKLDADAALDDLTKVETPQ